MTRSITLFLTFLVCNFSTASVVSYYGYSLDTETNIVAGGGLEWLQWDETIGQNVEEALNSYSSDGWKLATYADMNNLIAEFFGIFVNTASNDSGDDTDPNKDNGISLYWADTQRAASFTLLFGDTNTGVSANSHALFGDFKGWDITDTINGIYDDIDISSSWSSTGAIRVHLRSWDLAGASSSYYSTGVALVRPITVPLPTAAWFFMSALFGLFGLKHRVHSQKTHNPTKPTDYHSAAPVSN